MDYDIGDMARITAAFTTAAGVAVDPTVITLKVKTPALLTTTYTFGGGEIVKDSVGNYHLDYTIAASGWHRYEWQGTGAATASEPGAFSVRRNALLGEV